MRLAAYFLQAFFCGELSAAFEKHLATYGGLDICINSAGITTSIPFYKDQTDGSRSWKRTIDVKTTEAAKNPGVIINLGSASGRYPMYGDPIYSASKGGVVLFTRSLIPYKRQGSRVNVLCPEFVQTELGVKGRARIIDMMGGYFSTEVVVQGAFELIRDESKAGSCLWITKRRGLEYWPTPMEEAKYLLPKLKLRRRTSTMAPVNIQLPQSFEKLFNLAPFLVVFQ